MCAAFLTDAERAAVRAPLERAATLPPRCYTDPAFYALEQERVFRRGWIGVARVDELARPGDYVAFDLLGEPLVAVRGDDGRIRVLSRVCRHRWMPVVEEGRGCTRAFQCPYHLWTYGLDGRLRGAPEMQRTPGFDRDAVRLPELRSEEWEGFLFVSLDPEAPPLGPQLAPLAERIAPWRLGAMRTLACLDYEAPWNWKVTLENGCESYHHMGPHRATLEPVLPTRRTEVGPQAGPFTIYRNPTTDDAPLPTAFEPVPGLGGTERASLVIVTVFPFHLFALTPDQMSWLRILPGPEPDRHRARWVICAPPHAFEDPELETKREAAAALLDTIHREDMAICRGVQQGLASRLAAPSPFSHLEATVHHFHRWLLERVEAEA